MTSARLKKEKTGTHSLAVCRQKGVSNSYGFLSDSLGKKGGSYGTYLDSDRWIDSGCTREVSTAGEREFSGRCTGNSFDGGAGYRWGILGHVRRAGPGIGPRNGETVYAAGIIMSILGAIVLLVVVRLIFGRGNATRV